MPVLERSAHFMAFDGKALSVVTPLSGWIRCPRPTVTSHTHAKKATKRKELKSTTAASC